MPQPPRQDWPLVSLNALRSFAPHRSSSRRVRTWRQGLVAAGAVRVLVAGALAAVLLAPSAGARTGPAALPYIALCGPATCARTTDPAGVAQFKAFVGTVNDRQLSPFPPPVQAYYRVRSPYLRFPAGYAARSARLGIDLQGPDTYWTPLGPHTVAALRAAARRVRPYAAPLPSRVLVNNRRVKARAIYRHLFDVFPRISNLEPSASPWIGVAVTWPHGSPWSAASFTVRRGTRVMLRSDHAVRISAALAVRITADVPRKSR